MPRRPALEMHARYIVLLLLADGPKTGYEIIKRVKSLTAQEPAATVSPGTLYPLLRRLEEEGLLNSRSEPRGRRTRIVYSLTSKGLERLGEMLHRGLEALEAGLQLHLEAARGLRQAALAAGRLEEVEARLERLEETIRALRSLLQGGQPRKPSGGEGAWRHSSGRD